jgi:hypothetical protein
MTLGQQKRPCPTNSTIFRSLFDLFEEGLRVVGSLTKYNTVIGAVLLHLVSTMTAVSGALLPTSGQSEVKTFSCRGIEIKLLADTGDIVKVRILEDPRKVYSNLRGFG